MVMNAFCWTTSIWIIIDSDFESDFTALITLLVRSLDKAALFDRLITK